MNLVSPGVSVSIIDESFYGTSGPGTVPLIIIATESNKLTPAGDGVATYTLPSQAGKLFLATSQRELLQNYGNPIFRSVNGVQLHAAETNEYGLHAAYSYLGVSNRAYVVRADVDLAQLQASDTAPRGLPFAGTFWLDLTDTVWGIFQSNGSSDLAAAWVAQPTRVALTANVDSDFVPLTGFGNDGDFAVVPLTADNFIYEKINGVWRRVGSAAWNRARPTLMLGTANPSALTDGNVLRIGTTQGTSIPVTFTSSDLDLTSAIAKINAALAAEGLNTVLAAEENNNAITIRNISGTSIYLANDTGTPLTTLGLTAGLTRGNSVRRTADAQYPSGSIAGDVWVKGTSPNRGASWVVRVYDAISGTWTLVSAPFFPFNSALDDGNAAKDVAAQAALGALTAGMLYVGFDATTGVQSLRRWSGTQWEQLVYEADTKAPTTEPEDGTLWYSADFRCDLMVSTGETWIGYRRAFPETDPEGVRISATAPTVQSDGTALVNNDLWLDSSDLENYPMLRRYNASTRRWTLIDKTDQTTPAGIVFGDARADSGVAFDGAPNLNSYALESEAAVDMLLSDYLDPDAPDPRTYPAGMLLFNTRFSTYNVKVWRPYHFLAGNFDPNTDYTTETYTVGDPSYVFPETTAGRWVSASGNRVDGAAWMGRKAVRQMVVKAMAETISSNEDLRSELVNFNLLAAPGYPELIDEMQTLNIDQKEVSFIVGDSPARLAANATAIQRWANNTAGAASNGEDGLVSSNVYVGVYYPWGFGTNTDGSEIMVPPSTIALRCIAYSDSVSYPWFAPAGFQRGLVTNATTVGYLTSEGEFKSVILNSGQRDTLYENRINPIAYIPNRGLVLYGQKTRSSVASALDRINVARLVNYLKYNLDNLVKPYLFEQNDSQTRDSVKITCERYLNTIVGLRGLEDYAVLCSEDNNTPERIDRNELWIDILIKPIKAIEFIYVPVRIRSTSDSLNFGVQA